MKILYAGTKFNNKKKAPQWSFFYACLIDSKQDKDMK